MGSDRLKKLEYGAYEEVKDKILDLLDPAEGGIVLDVGCDLGTFSAKVGNELKASKVFGVDVNQKSLKHAKSKGVITKQYDISKGLPYKSNTFDVVICNQVAEHMMDPDILFEEIYRVMKKNGQAIISVPNLLSLHNRLMMLFGKQPTTITPSTRLIFGNFLRGKKSTQKMPDRHFTGWSPAAFKEMTKYYKFKIEKYAGSGFHPFTGSLSRMLSSIFPGFAVFQIVKVRK